MRQRDRGFPFFVLSAFLAIFVGTAHAEQTSVASEPARRLLKVRTIGILDPTVDVFELSAGGIREKKDEWCAQGRSNITGEIVRELSKKGYTVKVIERTGDLRNSLEEISDLYQAIVYSYRVHSLRGPNYFASKGERFDYSVGALDQILDVYGVDSLVLAFGIEESSTGGRKALMAVGALTGVIFRAGGTLLNVSLADRDGTIYWNEERSGGSLTDQDSVKNTIAQMFDELPKATP